VDQKSIIGRLKQLIQCIFAVSFIILAIPIEVKIGSSNVWESNSIILWVIALVGIIMLYTTWFIKNLFNKFVALLVEITILFPIILLSGMGADWGIFKGTGTLSDWIGFWGSYVGSIIGTIGAVIVSYWSTKKQLEESKKNDFINSLKLNDINLLNKIFEQTNDIYYKLENIYLDIGKMKSKKYIADQEGILIEVDNKFNSIIDPYGTFLKGQMLLFSYPSDDMKIKWNQIVKCVAQVRYEINKAEEFIIDEQTLDNAYKKLLNSFLDFSNAVAANKENLTNINK
jgi:hypothetical protein